MEVSDHGEPSEPLRKRKRLLEYRRCPHCKNMLKFKKFQDHKRLFYDATTKEWIKEMTDTSDSDIEISDVDDLVQNRETSTPEPEYDWDNIFEVGAEDHLPSPEDQNIEFQHEGI